ncbi:MAG: gamma-glutamyl-gamma-aminobutyrate hydrolase family protein [Alphaproteobacteria bacterium]
MMNPSPTPLVGIPACRISDEGRAMHRVGDKYINAVYDVAQCTAIVVPAMAERHDFDVLIDRLDGVFLTTGRVACGIPDGIIRPFRSFGPPSTLAFPYSPYAGASRN